MTVVVVAESDGVTSGWLHGFAAMRVAVGLSRVCVVSLSVSKEAKVVGLLRLMRRQVRQPVSLVVLSAGLGELQKSFSLPVVPRTALLKRSRMLLRVDGLSGCSGTLRCGVRLAR